MFMCVWKAYALSFLFSSVGVGRSPNYSTTLQYTTALAASSNPCVTIHMFGRHTLMQE